MTTEIKQFPFGLPPEVLSEDPGRWVAPSSEQIRVVVGLRSVTGVSGAIAGRLVGISEQNFRKYTAKDGAVAKHKISFAMWHLLLIKLSVLPAKIYTGKAKQTNKQSA